jgi:hypothetical protein
MRVLAERNVYPSSLQAGGKIKVEPLTDVLCYGLINNRLGRMSLDIIQNILYGFEFFCLFVGDFDIEFLFHGHN